MDLNTAKEFVEKYPGYMTLVDTETCMLSASKIAIERWGYKSVEQMENISYYDYPVKGNKLAIFFDRADKKMVKEGHRIKELIFCLLKNNEKSMIVGEKFLIKNKNDEATAMLGREYREGYELPEV